MLSDAAANLMLDALDESQTSGAKYWSLHTAYSTSGANEVSGGSYTRQAATWAAASSRSKASTGSPAASFSVPASTTVAWVGRWTASTSGTFLGMAPAGGGNRRQVTANASGVTANTLDSPAHGLTAGTAVVFWASTGAALPTGLVEGTIYYVIATGLTTDVFSVSATSGGSAVDITAVGDGEVQTIVPETFTGAGTYNLTSDTLSVSV